jgi:ribosomal protein L27
VCRGRLAPTGKDDTLYARAAGTVVFGQQRGKRVVSIAPPAAE